MEALKWLPRPNLYSGVHRRRGRDAFEVKNSRWDVVSIRIIVKDPSMTKSSYSLIVMRRAKEGKVEGKEDGDQDGERFQKDGRVALRFDPSPIDSTRGYHGLGGVRV